MDLTKENGNNGDHGAYSYGPSSGYALSGKIMLSAVVILFTVVIVFVCLHIYARWYLLRARRRHREQRTRRRTHIIFSYEPSAATDNTAFALSRGLEESVLRSLPTFVYSSATHGGGVLECAVCLSEFEDNEKGRLLPKCNHSFHIDCIDMWFQSHSTCPLCRTPVSSEIPAPSLPNENPAEVAIRVAESESGPSSGICPSCRFDSSTSSYSQPSSSSSSPPYSADSSSLKTRAVTVSIEVPRRNGSFRGLEEGELCLGSPRGQGFKSPGGQQGLKSPGGRILSLKRILSREWKGCVSPSSVAGGSYSAAAAAEIDLENGEERPRSSSTQ